MKSLRIRYSILFGIFFLSTAVIRAQNLPLVKAEEVGMSSDRLERITGRFQQYVDNGELGGTVTLIARKGKVVYYEALGYQDVESEKVMEKEVIFRIASQTKAIVSAGIMILQEEGRLLIQDKVGDYIPEFMKTTVAVPAAEGGYEVVPAKRAITIRDLLTHTAGIGYGYGLAKDQWEAAGIQGWYFADRDEPILKTVSRMAALPMDAQPGEKWVYGYSIDILGAVIEVASGMPLDVFLKMKIFDPLGMKDTHFYLPKNKTARLATVYHPEKGQPLKPAPTEGTMDAQGAYVKGPRKSFSGGAGLLSTARDYYLFLQTMANGGELNGVRILSPVSVDLMTANHLKDIDFRDGAGFGLGFEVVTDLGQRGFPGYGGSFGWGGAYGSTYWVDPEQELVVVYFTQVRPRSVVSDQQMLRWLTYQAIMD